MKVIWSLHGILGKLAKISFHQCGFIVSLPGILQVSFSMLILMLIFLSCIGAGLYTISVTLLSPTCLWLLFQLRPIVRGLSLCLNFFSKVMMLPRSDTSKSRELIPPILFSMHILPKDWMPILGDEKKCHTL